VDDVHSISYVVLTIVRLAVLGVQVYALVDAAIRPAAAYAAAGKLAKQAWVAILAVSLLLGQLVSLINPIGLAVVVATIVYFVDVRPALRNLGS